MKKILISCKHLQHTIDNYKKIFEQNNILIDIPLIKQALSEKELLEIISKYDGVIAGDDEFTNKVLHKGSNSKLKVISKWGIGIDNINVCTAGKLGIKIYNTPNVFNDEVANVVIGYIISLARNLHYIDKGIRKGNWEENQIQGISIRNKTLGIIGLGNIGQAISERATILGMKIIGYDIKPIKGIKLVTFNTLIHSSDFISLNCNLTIDNKHMIGEKEFNKMNKPIFVINTARGALINEKALIKALKENKINGAALDVFEQEPLPKNSPLFQFDNCILGTHNSSNTYEAVMRTNDLAIKNLIKGLSE